MKTLQKLRSKKGFTLMEMLIVVAIIAILVAVAIPTFTNALNKAKKATDAANLRNAYAEAQLCSMLEQDPLGAALSSSTAAKYYMQKDGSFVAGDAGKTLAYQCKTKGAAGEAGSYKSEWNQNQYIIINYTAANATTGTDAKFEVATETPAA